MNEAFVTAAVGDPLCTVVVPVYNNEFYTRLCLDALARTRAAEPRYELVVVDNASTDGTAGLLESRSGQIQRVVHNNRNLGFATACNQGAAGSVAPYLVFLNNDVVVEAGWLGRMIGLAESDANVGVVGARLLYPNGTIQHAGVSFGTDFSICHAYAGQPGDCEAALRSRDCQAVTGACMLARRDLFESLGGFDAEFRNSFEDIDFCLRARERGRRVAYCADAVGHHFESATTGRLLRDERNYALFHDRWEKRIRVDVGDVLPPRVGATSEASVAMAQLEQLGRDVGALRAERDALRSLLAGPADPLTASAIGTAKAGGHGGGRGVDAIYQPATLPPLFAGSRLPLPVAVRNAGTSTWSANRYSLSYRWRRVGDSAIGRDEIRAQIGEPVKPGEWTTVMASLVVPTVAGEYLLEWDLVEEHTTWLSWEGVTPYTARTVVLPSTAGRARARDLPTSARTGETVDAVLDIDLADGAEPTTIGLSARWRLLTGEVTGSPAPLEFDLDGTGPSVGSAMELASRTVRARTSLRAPSQAGICRLEVGANTIEGAWVPILTLGSLIQVLGEETALPADAEAVALLVAEPGDWRLRAERAEYLLARANGRLAEGNGPRRWVVLARRQAAYLLYRRIPRLLWRRQPG